MTQTLSRIFTGILGLALVLGAFAPATAVHAQEDGEEPFCEVADEKKAETITRIQAAIDRHLDRRDELVAGFDALVEAARTKYHELKDQYDAEAEEAYQTLLNSNPNEEQKVALEEFRSTVLALIEARTNEHIALNDAWRESLDAETGAIVNEVLAALEEGKTSIIATYDDAQNDCEAGIDGETIRAGVRESGDQIRADWRAFKEGAEIKARLDAILSQRKADQTALTVQFQDDVRLAGEALRDVWGGTANTGLDPQL